jgi:hypothetical protein
MRQCKRCGPTWHYLWIDGDICTAYCSECYLIAGYRDEHFEVLCHANEEVFWALPTGEKNHNQIKHTGPHRKVMIDGEKKPEISWLAVCV